MGIVCKLIRSDEIEESFEKNLKQCEELKIAVAFLKRGGMDKIKSSATDFLSQGKGCQIVVGMSQYYITDPDAIKRLLTLQDKYKNKLKLFYSSKKSFHPKLFLFKSKDALSGIIGSSNLTGGGTGGNLEANIFVQEKDTGSSVLNELLSFFEDEIIRCTSPLTWERYSEYLHDYKEYKSRSKHSGKKFKPKLKETKKLGKMGPYADTNENDGNGFETSVGDLDKEVFWKLFPAKYTDVLDAWEGWKHRIKPNGEGLIGIGWDNVGAEQADTKSEIEEKAKKVKLVKKPGYVANQHWSFYHEMREGHYVVAYGKSSILGVGNVLEDKVIHSKKPLYNEWYKQQRKVKWLRTKSKLLTETQRHHLQYPRYTLHKITDKKTIRLIKKYIGE